MRAYLSYSHHDKEIAQLFHRHFTESGFDVSWDGDITYGSRLDKLQSMILNCDVFIVIISGHSLESKYVQSEISLALGYMGTQGKPILPYIRTNNHIPSNLLQYQCFMGTDDVEGDAVALTNALERILGSMFAAEETVQRTFAATREIVAEKAADVKENLSVYTDEVFKRLERNEKRDRRIALILYSLSVGFLAVATILSISKIRTITGDADILRSIEYIMSDILTLAIVVALSRLSFTLGKAFMTNAIRSGDRIHAISFGKFFIEAYGEGATREEVRAVFGEWNIDKGTSFHSQSSSDFDPNIMSALDVIKGALAAKKDS